MDLSEAIIYAVFRSGPKAPVRSLCEAMRRGIIPPRYVGEALAILKQYDSRPRKPTWAIPARSLYNDPGWDNVIRAYEEDR